ncbi:MAG TPA: WYL domain-containing protein [Vicinamibacteria bacterium]|nr:WYL domain-containing protein [Vicinamibacteria bacterium]
MRNAEVIRQWKILKTVEAGRHTTTQALADDLGVTERTIRRDVEALQEAGFPLYDEREDGRKVWRLVPGYKQKLTQSFSLSELAALYFGKNLLSYLGGAPFARDLESAFTKIREALPAKSLPYLARIQDLFAARPDPAKDYSKKKDVIAGLVDATLHQRQANVAYYSFNSKRTKAYLLDPYRLVYYHGGLYLYACSHEHGEVRTFAVERIERIEVLETTFEVPKDFNVSEYARGAFGIAGGKAEDVVLEVDAAVAAYVRERVWHESQSVEERADGGLVLRMKVTPGFELKSWIKSFLPHVRVQEPVSLRREIAGELEAARPLFLPR